jgi:hypothetical protein
VEDRTWPVVSFGTLRKITGWLVRHLDTLDEDRDGARNAVNALAVSSTTSLTSPR